MSWPKRDGSYSFLMHLGPFGCITTAIFSENAILSKTRFEKKIHTKTSTDNWVQFDEVLAIFHTPQGTQGVWKIAKKPNHIVKFGCGNGCVKLYFFQKIRFFSSKNRKNYKKNDKNIFPVQNVYIST